jgi:hypothetical protein
MEKEKKAIKQEKEKQKRERERKRNKRERERKRERENKRTLLLLSIFLELGLVRCETAGEENGRGVFCCDRCARAGGVETGGVRERGETMATAVGGARGDALEAAGLGGVRERGVLGTEGGLELEAAGLEDGSLGFEEAVCMLRM